MSDRQRTKKWAPKTFNGCLTCKRRRVKCDETKPTCERCLRSKLQCEGYAPPAVRVFEPSKPTQPEQEAEDTKAIVRTTPAITSLLPNFGSPEELRSLNFFLEKTSDLIAVYSQRHFWTVIIPQATWQHPAIRHSVIALAILHESLTHPDGFSADRNDRLIHHYNSAIREITQGIPRTDIVLMTCLLFWKIERFHGSSKTTVDHLNAALSILEEWKDQQNENTSTYHELITKHIEPTIRDGIYYSTNQRIVEVMDDEDDCGDLPEGIAVESSHTAFTSLQAAADHLTSDLKSVFSLKKTFCLEKDSAWPIGRVRAAFRVLSRHLHSWIDKFHSLSTTGSVFQRRMLLLHHIAAITIVADMRLYIGLDLHCPTAHPTRLAYIMDELEDLYNSRTDERLYSDSSEQKGLENLCPIPILFLIAVKSTEEGTVKRAISLLLRLSSTEGQWNNVLAAKIAEGVSSVTKRTLENFDDPINVYDIEIQRSEVGLKVVYDDGTIYKERHIGVSAEEFEKIDADKLTEVIRQYGYQFEVQSHT